MHFANADLLVDARTVFAGRLLCSPWAANGLKLLCCCDDPVRAERPSVPLGCDYGKSRIGAGKIGINGTGVNAATSKKRQ
jgi:hypothetical protein